ncbi:polysaccharide deacetylase family protein [Myceligenerans xiligouense]|uniref:Peptidoglycan/xylan/chitin deacetylase (PgdA/CDA1 family) n=1 Tax=Myceligenerans xiligouense TaxID=253184 RepID=A0A3N4ZB23_9MICO|nr:polysaccharide deacetylase family protein [Myceligenerans xiligouense]RPF22642.1 peptidoglycan/xylan/chitin deacetylase (PgdA/CDA1 family) [Myceligenerans xiligouense]
MSKTFTNPATGRRSGRLARALATAGAAAVVGLTGIVAAPAADAADCSAGYVSLTFDDGPNSGTSNQIISILDQYDATATMFPTGQNAQSNPGLMQAYAAAGLQIGNHSWDHPYLTQLSQSQVQQQLSSTSNAIQQTAGVTPDLFRPPYGATNSTVQQVASSLGMRQIIWDVDSQDYNGISASQIRSAASGLSNGQIILMHDWPQNTVQALPGILQDLENRNLCTGHISPSTGRAVAPGGGDQQPPGGGDGTCTVTVTRAEQWGDRFNTTFSVNGTNDWRVTITTGSGQTLQNSWNASISGTSGTLTATPNGNGNSFGITLYSNGNTASPTATCSTT